MGNLNILFCSRTKYWLVWSVLQFQCDQFHISYPIRVAWFAILMWPISYIFFHNGYYWVWLFYTIGFWNRFRFLGFFVVIFGLCILYDFFFIIVSSNTMSSRHNSLVGVSYPIDVCLTYSSLHIDYDPRNYRLFLEPGDWEKPFLGCIKDDMLASIFFYDHPHIQRGIKRNIGHEILFPFGKRLTYLFWFRYYHFKGYFKVNRLGWSVSIHDVKGI